LAGWIGQKTPVMKSQKLLLILAHALHEKLQEIASDVGTKKNIPGRLAEIDQAHFLVREIASLLVNIEEITTRESKNPRLLRLLRMRKMR